MDYTKITNEECYKMRSGITDQMKREYCKAKGLFQMAYEPDLDNPKTLNEKIIWLALNYKNPEIKLASDKCTAKEWISKRIGSDYVVPLIGNYDSPDDIDFASLPQSFVIKSNCGWAAKTVKVVADKSKLDISSLKLELSEWLKPWSSYYYANLCISDEDIKPRLLIEEMLGNGTSMIEDYKLFCLNGKPRFMYVVEDRNGASQSKTFLDLDWNIMDCHRYDVPPAKFIEKPETLGKMLELGSILSKEFPLVRVDFYFVGGKLYVGELTFTPGMFLSIEPKEWDKKLGNLLTLPKLK